MGAPAEAVDLEALLRRYPEKFGSLLDRAAELRLQILLGEIVETGDGGRLERSGYRVDEEYFYPASTVKTSAVLAALELIDDLSRDPGNVDVDTPLRFMPLFEGEEVEDHDPQNVFNGTITVRQAAREVFLVSDNQAFNWLYELVGYEELNARLARAGLESARVIHRLDEFRPPEEQRMTPRIEILRRNDLPKVILERRSELALGNPEIPGIEVGKAYYSGGELVEEPMSFLLKNRFSLLDLQNQLAMIVRPELDRGDHAAEPFRVPMAMSDWVLEAMSQYPSDSENPRYDREEYPDHYVKYLLPGLERVVPRERLRIYNKVGRAYGFSIENAYVVDVESGKGFFLSAVIYTNADGRLNDDEYEYEEIADPFLADLGEVVAREVWGLVDD